MELKEYEIMFNAEGNYWWYKGLHHLILQFIHKKGNNLKIIDAGCGTCRMLQLLAENHNVEGFDFSPQALDFCKKRNIENVYLQDINLWQPQKKYDIIINTDVICSLGIENEQKIIENFYQSLNSEGILILNLPALEILRRNHDKAVHIRKRYKKNEIENMLKNAGFKNIFVTYRLPWLFFIILSKKIWQKTFSKNEIKSDLKNLPSWLNKFFYALNKIENSLILKKVKMPFGSSVFAVAKK